MKQKKNLPRLLLGLAALIGIIIGLGISVNMNGNRGTYAEKPAVPLDAPQQLDSFSTALSKIAAIVSPSVVNISTTKPVKRQQMLPEEFYNNPYFRRFFKEPGTPENENQMPPSAALGSGVIVTPNGYILTNNHVIEGAEEISVTLHDRRTFKAELIGADPKTDLALLKIDMVDLPALVMNENNDLQVGEIVMAVGIPFGLSNTVTMGIVSAVGRSNVGIVDYEDFIQTDAAINPGNSGGALVNSYGELVGINTAIFSTSGGNMGVGFAIPVKMARTVMDSLLEHGKVIRGWLGVAIQDITPELAGYFNVPNNAGALITDVVDGSPADKSGLEQQDVIIGYDGSTITQAADLKNRVAGTAPGERATVTIVRAGEEKDIDVTIGELAGSKGIEVSQVMGTFKFHGASVQNLTDELRAYFAVPESVDGVVVTDVDTDSAANGILQQKDIILQIDKHKIASLEELRKAAAASAENNHVLVLVYREGGRLFLTIEPEQ